MLTLIFPKTELTSASIPVRWCVDEDALTTTTNEGLSPYILFQIDYHSGHPKSFKLFPLDQFSAYLDIHHPGKVDIQAWLVTATQNSKAAISKLLMSTSSYERETAYAFSEYETYFRTTTFNKKYVVKTFDESIEHSFDIDSNLFGKELPEWAKFFINRYWYESKPVDECAQRRRIMLFPFTTLLPLLVETSCRWLWNLWCCVALWLCLIGANPKHLLHPFDGLIDKDVVKDMPTFYDWVLKQPKYSDSFIAWCGLITFTPPVYLVSVGFVHWASDYTWLQCLYAGPGWLWIAVISLIVVVSAIYFPIVWCKKHVPDAFSTLMYAIAERFWIALDKFIDWMETFQTTSARKRELLLCHDEDGHCLPELTLKDKPATLIFADLKNKVCRPMRG